MTNDDDGIPGWARPLVRGPIKVDGTTDADQLAHEFRERLEALLQHYNCDASPEGWRTLALQLALDHEIVPGQPVMRVVTPVDRPEQTGGVEPGKNYFFAMRLAQEARRTGKSRKEVSKAAARKTDLSIGRIQNLMTDLDKKRLPKPREMQRWRLDAQIRSALEKAADRLEADHETDPMDT